MTAKAQQMMMVGVSAVAAVAFAVLVILPGLRARRALQDRIRIEQAAAVEEQSRVARLPGEYKTLQDLSKEMGRFQTAIPPQHRFGDAYATMRQAIEAAGADDYAISPAATRPAWKGEVPGSLRSAAALRVQPVRIELVAPTSVVVRVLDAFERWERLNVVERFRLSSAAQPEGAGVEEGRLRSGAVERTAVAAAPPVDEHAMRCELTVQLYYLPREPVASAPPPAGEPLTP